MIFKKTSLFIIFVYIVLFYEVARSEIKNLVIHGGYSFETMEGQSNGAAYISIFNNSNNEYVIKSIKSDIANKVEIHDVKIENNIVKMKMLDVLKIKKNQQIFMQPGGKHIMLFGLKKKLVEGENYTLSIVLDKNQIIEAEILVVSKKLKEKYLD